MKTINCFSSANFKNLIKFLSFFFFFCLDSMFVSPTRLWNDSQLTSQIAHVYSHTHFISVWWESYFLSKILARFCFSTFSNLKVMFFRVNCRQKIINNVNVVVRVVLFDFYPKISLNLISDLIWLTIWFPVELILEQKSLKRMRGINETIWFPVELILEQK